MGRAAVATIYYGANAATTFNEKQSSPGSSEVGYKRYRRMCLPVVFLWKWMVFLSRLHAVHCLYEFLIKIKLCGLWIQPWHISIHGGVCVLLLILHTRDKSPADLNTNQQGSLTVMDALCGKLHLVWMPFSFQLGRKPEGNGGANVPVSF